MKYDTPFNMLRRICQNEALVLIGRRSGKTLLQMEIREMTAEMRADWKRKAETIGVAEIKGLIKLNDWETQFMGSVRDRLGNNQDLTMQQSINLNKIYRRIG